MKIFSKVLKIGKEFKVNEYIQAHQPEHMWPETVAALNQIGVLDMELYLQDNSIIMTMITPDNFDHDAAMETLATLPKQAEWEAHVAQFQGVSAQQAAKDKWQLMSPIYSFKTCFNYLEKNKVCRQ